MWPRRQAGLAGLGTCALLLLGGCVDAPHPFRPEDKPLPVQLSGHPEWPSVVTVAPVVGAPAPLDRALADAMAAALSERSLPATTDMGDGAYAIYSVTGRVVGAGSGALVLWEVRDAHGELVGRQSQPLPPLGDPASPDLRRQLVAELDGKPADTMAKGIEGDAPVPKATALAAVPPAEHRQTVVVAKIEGAPGERGDLTLRQAIEYALKVAKVNIATEKAPDSLLLLGTVATTELPAGARHVKVTWTVQEPDGRALGEVSQENNVPARLLDLAWGEISSAVAQNAVGGITALIAKADKSPAAQ